MRANELVYELVHFGSRIWVERGDLADENGAVKIGGIRKSLAETE